MFAVILTSKAETDIETNVRWWSENRSRDQAERWYSEIAAKINTLEQMPLRCSTAPEGHRLNLPIKHLLFGLSSRPTHRVLFTIVNDQVIVLRVLHTSQDAIVDVAEL